MAGSLGGPLYFKEHACLAEINLSDGERRLFDIPTQHTGLNGRDQNVWLCNTSLTVRVIWREKKITKLWELRHMHSFACKACN